MRTRGRHWPSVGSPWRAAAPSVGDLLTEDGLHSRPGERAAVLDAERGAAVSLAETSACCPCSAELVSSMDPGPDAVNESGLASSKCPKFMDYPFHALSWLFSPLGPLSRAVCRTCCPPALCGHCFSFFHSNAGSTFPSTPDIPGLYVTVSGLKHPWGGSTIKERH